MKLKEFFIYTIAFILVIILAMYGYNYFSKNYEPDYQDTHTNKSVKAPDFTVYDENSNPVNLSEFTDKPVIINFWATWCGPCTSELPAFNESFKLYNEKIHFLMVNLTDGQRETMKTVKKFISENGYEFPIYYDTEYDAASTYGAYSIPLSIFIDENGYVVNSHSGAMSHERLQKYINQLLD